MLHYATFYDECAPSCSSPQPLIIDVNHSYLLLLKKKISQTLTFRLCYANQLVERYEKSTTEFTQFVFNQGAENQTK